MQFICTYCTTFFNAIELKNKSFPEILLLLSNNLLQQLFYLIGYYYLNMAITEK